MASSNRFKSVFFKLRESFQTYNIWISNAGLKQLSTKAEKKEVIEQIFPDVEGSPQPLPKNFYKRFNTKKKSKQPSPEKSIDKTCDTKHVVIDCKNRTLNHYINQTYDKFSELPLASKGWQHPKSKGDYFKINIFPDEEQRESVFWPDDVDSYEGLGLDDNIVEALKRIGFTRPTHIQAQGIPAVLKNQNTLLAGETGCGKTLAYLLPVVQHILRWRRLVPDQKLNTPLALILVPSRELTQQIGDVADRLARELLFNLEVIVGGNTKRLMSHPNFHPVDLLVSSTGAASKLTTTGIYNMSYVRHIVLDEADTLFDDSFNELISRYLKKFPIGYAKDMDNQVKFPDYCQMTLASATMPTSLHSLLDGVIMPNSLVKVQTPRLHQVLVNVPQCFLRLSQSLKPTRLLELAKKNAAQEIPTIIFSNRSKVSDWVSMFLNENGISCINLNGDMPVGIRAGRFDQFQRGFVDFLSCSDIASRGLDTIRAKHVINYDFPIHMADYIHRCGRVGRVTHTKNCLITNFVAGPMEVELVRKIETAVRTVSLLPNVNANITRIIRKRIMGDMF